MNGNIVHDIHHSRVWAKESKLTLGGVEVTPSELEIAEREIGVFIYGYLLMGKLN